MNRTAPFQATRIDISDRPAAERVIPAGWTDELLTAVEEGRISYRRAREIGEATLAGTCLTHPEGCADWPTEPTAAWTDDELKAIAVQGTLAQRDAAEVILLDRQHAHAMAMGWDKITDADREAMLWDEVARDKARDRAEEFLDEWREDIEPD